MDKSFLPQALRLYEERTGKHVFALIPGEIGQELIIVEAALILGLPIVDADLCGCRAVPRLTDLALVVRGIPFMMSPLVLMQSDGQCLFISQQASLNDDEDIVRATVPKGGIITMLGGAVSGKTIKKYLNYSSYSRAEKLGKCLEAGSDVSNILPTKCLLGPIEAQITSLEKIEEHGFQKKRLLLQSKEHGVMSLDVENEYMSLSLGAVIFQFPQLIMLVSKVFKRGIHSGELKKDDTVTVVVADAFNFWKEKSI